MTTTIPLAIALGAAGSAILALWSPLSAADPLRSTLVVLPLVLAAIAVSDALPSTAGRHRSLLPELAAFTLIAALAVLRPRLGPPGSEKLLVAALFLAMVAAGVRRRSSLRRLLGRRLPRTPPLPFFLLPLAMYLAILPWSTIQRPPDGDEPWYLLVTHSIAYDFDVDLANNYRDQDSLRFMGRAIEPQLNDPTGEAGQIYSRHSPLLPLLLAPGYRLAGKHGALLLMAVIAAAVAWMLMRVAGHYWPDRPGEVLLVWAIVAFSPPLLYYSHQLWVEVPAALAVLIALDAVGSLRRHPTRLRPWLMLGAMLLALVLFKLRFGLIAAPMLLLALLEARNRRRRVQWIAAAAAAGIVAFLTYNQLAFGNPLRIHSWSELLLFRQSLRDYALHLSGLFFDLAFGLFAAAPIWMLLVPAAVYFVRSRSPLRRDLLLLVVPYLVMVASRQEWYGGWSPHFRYPLALLPLLALLLVPLLRDRRALGPRILLAALLGGSLALALMWVTTPGWTYSFANGRNHLLDHLASQIGGDVFRLFPSSTRPRLASYLWPPAAIVALIALWFGLRPRARVAAPVAALLGVGALLLGGAALPAAARLAATRTIEVESPHVTKSGGHPDPDPWVTNRRRFAEAWALREGESASAPVIAGGEQVTLVLYGRFIRNRDADLELQVRCGDRPLAAVRFDRHDVHESRTIGPFLWDAGGRLQLAIPEADAGAPAGIVNGVILDRIELTWSDQGAPPP